MDCVALGDTFDQVILPHDVATYGGLCALATYDRSEIQVFIFSFSLCYLFHHHLFINVFINVDGSNESLKTTTHGEP